MKRNKIYSVLLASMLLATSVPLSSYAETSNNVDRVITVKSGSKTYTGSQSNVTQYQKKNGEALESGEVLVSEVDGKKTVAKLAKSDAPILRIKNTFGDLKQGDTFDLELKNGVWESSVKPYVVNASGTLVPSSTVSASKVYDTRLSIYINSNIAVNDFLIVPMEYKATGNETQEVTVLPRNSGVTQGTYKISKSGDSLVTLTINKTASLTKDRDSAVSLTLDENTNNAFEETKEVILRLPDDFYWSIKRNANVYLENGQRDLVIDTKYLNTANLDTLQIKADIVAERDARYTDIYARVIGLSVNEVKVGTYAENSIKVTVDKVLNVKPGYDRAGEYVARLIIEEAGAGSLDSNKYIKITGGKNSFELQDREVVRVRKISGDGTLDIALDNSVFDYDKSGNKFGSSATVYTRSARYVDSFELYTGDETNTASKFEVEIPFIVPKDYSGDVTLDISGAGITKESIVIAKTEGSAAISSDIEVSATIKNVNTNDTSISASDIVISEKKSGALGASTYSIEAPTGYTFTSADVKLDNGNVGIYKTSGIAENGKKINISIGKESTTASKIRITNVKLSKTTNNTGNVTFKLVGSGSDTKEFTYLSVGSSTNSSGNNAMLTGGKTTLRIGSSNYNQVVNGSTSSKSLDVAPYIKSGRTMLEMRSLANILGVEVQYNDATKIAAFSANGTTAAVKVGSSTMYVNSSPMKLSAMPEINAGRMCLSLTDVSKALNLGENQIEWNSASKTITINN